MTTQEIDLNAPTTRPKRRYKSSPTRNFFRYLRRNVNLGLGLVMFIMLILFTLFGLATTNPKNAYPLAVKSSQPPSAKYPFGTDGQGRDMYTVMARGIWGTLKIGFIAAFVGLGLGILLGFTSAYFGGAVDNIFRWVIDVFMTIPGFLILVVMAAMLGGKVSTEGTGLIIAFFVWAGPARVIRSQVLSLRERHFVLMAKLNGLGDMRIIIEELIPNLLPFLGALLIGTVMGAVYASSGLAILGLGNLREPQLGTTLYWMNNQAALVRGLWWWVAFPVVMLSWVFLMLYLISSGLDELANPKLRRRA